MRAGLAIAVVVGLLAAPAATARPVDKLDARLAQLATGKHPRVTPGGASVRPAGAPVRNGKVLVDVYVRGGIRDGAAALRDEGMRVEATSRRAPFRIVEGWVPVAQLEDIAALHSARAAVAVQEPIYNTGSATSEGDAVHRGPQVRAQGFTGAGIAVGVMSDSINKRGTGVAGSQGTNDLPANVQILAEPGSGTDEGRAMAQIVYDEAPGISKIIFATGSGGAVTRANNIDALVAAGSKVIADDVVYLGEPFFQDGVVAQAADRAKAAGVGYFVSAGNRARQSWEGTFTPSASTPAENDFDTGAGEDRQQTIATVPNGQQLSIFVQWANPVGAVTDDFALDFYNATTSTFLATINTNNVTTGIPAESAVLTGSGAGTAFAFAIRRVAGTGNPPLKWIANGAFTGALPAEFPAAPAIDPDAASARGALAVAAVRHNDAGNDTVESFSSRGPAITRYFGPTGNTLATPDVRAKPDIAAADGVATTTDFDIGAPDLNPFFGTSAAAPSAAGVAALLWSAKPSLSVDELYAILRDPRGSIDCTSAAGFPDADCGSGFLLADGKLPMVLDSTPPLVSAATSPGSPDGANGWFHSDVGVTWSVADAESPVGSQTGCDPQTVATDGVSDLTCSATSAGGTTSQPATVKRDATPPSSPAFTGITDGASFTTKNVPAAGTIGCTATDATSGVVSCAVSALSSAVGNHTLTATATDESGLSSTSTLSYAVTQAPKAAKSLKIGRQTIGSVVRSGFKFTLTVGTDSTRVDATLKLGKAKRAGASVGSLHKTVKRGKRKLTVKLSRAGQNKLRGLRRAKLALTVKAASATTTPVTLKKSKTLGG
jgi:subtilisin family serine protease